MESSTSLIVVLSRCTIRSHHPFSLSLLTPRYASSILQLLWRPWSQCLSLPRLQPSARDEQDEQPLVFVIDCTQRRSSKIFQQLPLPKLREQIWWHPFYSSNPSGLMILWNLTGYLRLPQKQYWGLWKGYMAPTWLMMMADWHQWGSKSLNAPLTSRLREW